jgi:tricarballylate dehydrogenase
MDITSNGRSPCDVLVVGGGNAGMAAALTARAAGARVVVLECAPRHLRGGNSRHARNLRCAHAAPTDVLAETYSENELLADLKTVNGGETDDALARLVVSRSGECVPWIRSCGARFQSALRGTLSLERTNAFFLGGGTALMNSYYAAAEKLGIDVRYDAAVVDLEIRDRTFHSATVANGGSRYAIRANAVVLAAGGFEANLAWLREAWGDAARNFVVRGTPHNTGTVLRSMLDLGAAPVADAKECHAVAVDGRAPRFDGGIVTRLDCVPLGIAVNRDAERFYDEGEDVWPKRYAIWGKLVARQPGQIAYSIVDAKVRDRFMPSVFPPIEAPSIRELAAKLSLPAERLEATVEAFNRAVRPGSFDASTLDDCRTEGLAPAKSHWAQRIDTPPFAGYPLKAGITFTYLGVRVDADARVLATDGAPFANVYAAGEIMAGNVLRKGYIAGIGMTIGTVFGRIAGESAAHHVGH